MSTEDRIYQALLIISTIAAALIPAWIAIENFKQQIPEKKLEISTGLSDASAPIGDGISISFRDKKSGLDYKNLVLATVQITNSGTLPITETDVKSPLTAIASDKFQILGVGQYGYLATSSPPSLNWEVVENGRSLRAVSPFLINPKESISFLIYLSRSSSELPLHSGGIAIGITWSTRIVGLKNIDASYYSSGYVSQPIVGGWSAFLDSYASALKIPDLIVFLPLSIFLFLAGHRKFAKIQVISKAKSMVLIAAFFVCSVVIANSIALLIRVSLEPGRHVFTYPEFTFSIIPVFILGYVLLLMACRRLAPPDLKT